MLKQKCSIVITYLLLESETERGKCLTQSSIADALTRMGCICDRKTIGRDIKALIEMGCDVIAQHCDTANPQIAAQTKNVFGCGYNSDMTAEAPKAHLTAPIWNWGVYYTAATKAAMDGKWEDFGNYYGSLADGLVDISPLSENCAENTAEYIKLVKDLFKEGTWDVFSGVKLSFKDGALVKTDADLKDNAGKVIVKAGEGSVEDSVITGTMNYFVEGVSLK